MRRSGVKIMVSLMLMLGSLSYVIILAVINGTLGFLCSIGVTLFGAFGIAKLLGGSIAMSYGLIAALCVSCGVLRGILRYFEQYSNHYIAFKSLAIIRDKLFKSLRILCPAKLETKKKGSIISMISADVETLEVFYAHTVSPIFIAVCVSLFIFIFTGLYASFYMASVALAGYLILGVLLPVITNKALDKSGKAYRDEFSSFNAYFLDSIKGTGDIVLHNAGQERKREVNRRSETLIIQSKKSNARSGFAAAFTQTVITLTVLASLIVGGCLVINGDLEFTKMLVCLVAVSSSFGPVAALSALPANLTQTFAAGNRTLDFLNEKSETQEVKNGADFEFESLNVRGLNFSYDKQEPVLDGVSIAVKRGQIVALCGESGCGKSTFLKLLLRFWQKDGGTIEFNGIDIDKIDAHALSRNVSLVSQSTYLFDDTVEENLKIAKQDATVEEIIEACKKASVHSFIESLPDGYKTKTGALGDKLSSGERQRIGLARAFLRGSPLILLDEPTSNVDSINEGIILKALKDYKRDKAIILVSHRESTMAIADKKYRMDKGRVVNEY